MAQELRDWVAKEIGPIAKPKDIRFGDNLPKTRSGKIMRRLLRSIAKGEEITQDVSTLENPGDPRAAQADAVAGRAARASRPRRVPVAPSPSPVVAGTTTQPPQLARATIAFLRRYAPFNEMEDASLGFVVARARLGYHSQGAVVVGPQDGVAQRLFIIQRGHVRARSPDGGPGTVASEFAPGEIFPIDAVLAARSTTRLYEAIEDLFCYELDAADVQSLLGASAPFQRFCARHIDSLLQQERRRVAGCLRGADRQRPPAPAATFVRDPARAGDLRPRDAAASGARAHARAADRRDPRRRRRGCAAGHLHRAGSRPPRRHRQAGTRRPDQRVHDARSDPASRRPLRCTKRRS